MACAITGREIFPPMTIECSAIARVERYTGKTSSRQLAEKVGFALASVHSKNGQSNSYEQIKNLMPDITLALGLLKKPLEAIGAIATGQTKQTLTKLKAANNLKKIRN